MKKSDFIKESAISAGLTQDAMKKALTGMIDTIVKELKNDGSVQITWFGEFKVSTRSPRVWRNPKTGEAIQLWESRTPNFKVAKSIKLAIQK